MALKSKNRERKDKIEFVLEHLSFLKDNNLYRQLRTVEIHGSTAIVNGQKAIHLCSNDYLGLSQNHKVILETIQSLKEISQCSSRLIAGNSTIFLELEKALSMHRNSEAALVYPTGYGANIGVITSVANKDTTIFSDELNHASIVDGCRQSGAKIEIFKHNDTFHLEQLLSKNKGKKKVVITEGIFSMDGDPSELREICSLAKTHNALVIVDDAHGDFIFGPRSSGIPSHLGVNGDVDIHISSLSKGLGCFGGYVATTQQVRELLINTSRQFIYTSALPNHLCTAALVAIKIAKRGDLQKKLFKNVSSFTKKMRKTGFILRSSSISSQIVPIIIGEEKVATLFSEELLKRGIFAQAVRYPTVKRGSSRLRVSLTALHNENDIASSIESFEKVGKQFGII